MNWSLLGLKRLTPTIMHKCLGTLLHFWGVFLSTQAHPLPYHITIAGRVYPEFCIRWGGGGGWGAGGLQENFKKDALFYEGTQNDRKI